MNYKIFSSVIPVCLAFVLNVGSAQTVWPGPQGPTVSNPPIQGQVIYGQTVYPGFNQGVVTYPPGTMIYPGNQVIYPGNPVYPGYPYYRPSVPAVVTPNAITGVNPQTGGLNTGNTQLNNTYFDPFRDQSQFNNSRRWEQRPVYNTFGQLTGYQQGWVWNNSVTGQEHGNLQTYTPNQFGGVHEGQVLYSKVEPSEVPDGGGQ